MIFIVEVSQIGLVSVIVHILDCRGHVKSIIIEAAVVEKMHQFIEDFWIKLHFFAHD
jgi:hypothetical protein